MASGETSSGPLAHDGPTAILFSAHPWHGLPLGLHHIARALVELGHAVVFVEPPFSPFHLAMGRRRGRLASRALRPSEINGIWLFSPFAFLAHQNLPLLRVRLILDQWPRLCLYDLRSALAGTAFATPDLVISGSPIFSSQVFAIEARLRAYRLADDDSLFSTISPSMRALAIADIARFDVVFATSRPLAETARAARARNVVLLPNGLDRQHLVFDPRPPADLDVLPRPRAIYVGALEQWFDWQAVRAAAAALPHVSFAIIGPCHRQPANLPVNVHLMGARPYDSVAAYLSHSDVGLIPFAWRGHEEALGAVSPIKLWEYLALGLPVVANAALDLPDLPSVVWQYRDPAEFVATLQAALQEKRRAGPAVDLDSRSWPSIVRRGLAEAEGAISLQTEARAVESRNRH